ncbi:MAG TPA: sialate O-acetylesterase, partial [Kiritimatiellia bacterium]|nr:sialate O-acetylesterase [Kiritimatiellia bacterium]
MMMQRTGFVLAASAALVAGAVSADVSLPNVFNHNMVLQRGQPVPVWGWAAPGEQVTVSFAGQSKKTVAGQDGAWRLALEALQASADPATFTVSGANTVTFTNVVVGEVWFCSGQSNMEWRMANVD